MGLFDFIGNIFKPASDLVDSLHTSDEERLKLENELAKIKEAALEKMTELEKARLDALSKVQVAEANSKHTIVAIWRPVSSLSMVAIIVAASFNLIPTPSQEFYELAQIFLGAYVSSRGIEKVAASIGGLRK